MLTILKFLELRVSSSWRAFGLYHLFTTTASRTHIVHAEGLNHLLRHPTGIKQQPSIQMIVLIQSSPFGPRAKVDIRSLSEAVGEQAYPSAEKYNCSSY